MGEKIGSIGVQLGFIWGRGLVQVGDGVSKGTKGANAKGCIGRGD